MKPEARLKALRSASRELRALSAGRKSAVLKRLRTLLRRDAARILRANARDLAALAPSASPAFRDRLRLDPARIDALIEGVRQIERLADPVGEVVERRRLSNGLAVRRVRAPLGVIFLIFESRPNVAVEAFALAFKAGNALILKGGRESARTVAELARVIRAAQGGLDAVWDVSGEGRALTDRLLGEDRWIDVVVPRGGEGLIRHVVATSRIPIIKNDRGVCHVYVHSDADLEMAADIVHNAKVQRPGVCNSMETVLVHRAVAPRLLPALRRRLRGVRWRGDAATVRILKAAGHAAGGVVPARATDFDREYLDLEMNCRVVGSLAEAIAHVEAHGSRHSEAIVTRSARAARAFQAEIDAAAVYWNASTRFTDGFELGLGGELGISTQKLHARGPVGLRELTSVRWLMDGKGQTRK